ncbi:MAG: histidine phosphatase family protein [Candidatus Nealsonbacteria bacterium]|nr:histidine phosphatase family protein [Candidatus Nealsonbacteria bacterium]
MIFKNSNRKIILVRHGETEWNREGRHQGHLDSPLTEKGQKQVYILSEKIKESGLAIDCIVSSDLGRARQTAEILKEELNIDCIKFTPAFRERNYGLLQGMLLSEIQEKYPDLVGPKGESLRNAPEVPSGEALKNFTKRVMLGMRSLRDLKFRHNLILVTHYGTASLILASLGIKLVGRSFLEDPRLFLTIDLDKV